VRFGRNRYFAYFASKHKKIKNSFPLKADSHMTQPQGHPESTQNPTRTPSSSPMI